MMSSYMLEQFLKQYAKAEPEIMRNAAICKFAEGLFSYDDMIQVFAECNVREARLGRTPLQVALGTDYRGEPA